MTGSGYTSGVRPKWFEKLMGSVLLGHYRYNLDLNEITHLCKLGRNWRVEYKGNLCTVIIPEPILENKNMWVIFQKKWKKNVKKRAKYLKIWTKMYKIRKYHENSQVIACGYCMQ